MSSTAFRSEVLWAILQQISSAGKTYDDNAWGSIFSQYLTIVCGDQQHLKYPLCGQERKIHLVCIVPVLFGLVLGAIYYCCPKFIQSNVFKGLLRTFLTIGSKCSKEKVS